jgi:hypothetical protein
MNNIFLKLIAVWAILLFSSTLGAVENIKSTLSSNGIPIYFNLPGPSKSFQEMFSEGKFYGRLRSNNFYYQYKKEDTARQNHFIGGVGTSLIYRSAKYNGFDFGVGMYASKAFFGESVGEVGNIKAGKDLLSRYDYANSGDKHMAVLGLANIKYRSIKDTDIILGRQLVETFYAKSNDTKMIPNTFEGLMVTTRIIPKSELKIGYLTKEKLRDHTRMHSVLMYDDRNSAEYSEWNGNDDSVMHKGLTYTALKAAGKPTDAPLIVSDFKNKSFKDLTIDASLYSVPELLSQGMLEFNYRYRFDNFTMIPGIRYINQLDQGAGKVGGASYSNDTTGYKDPDSLDAQMIAARLVTRIGNYKINLGYSYVLDQADLINPWRGFPTTGYTRSMGVYNWIANTKSYRLELVYDSSNSGIYNDMYVETSALYIDGDDEKTGEKDQMYYYLGLIQNLPALPSLQWRFRVGYAQFLDSADSDLNCLDSRFEVNYMF